jgi:hypothetical protein
LLKPRSSQDSYRDQYPAPGTRAGTFPAAPYPRPERPYREPAGGNTGSAASANTPPYGENYGLDGGYPNPATAPTEPRRRHHRDGRGEGNGRSEAYGATWPPYGDSGGYRNGGARPGGGYPGTEYLYPGGHPGNGHRRPQGTQGRPGQLVPAHLINA